LNKFAYGTAPSDLFQLCDRAAEPLGRRCREVRVHRRLPWIPRTNSTAYINLARF